MAIDREVLGGAPPSAATDGLAGWGWDAGFAAAFADHAAAGLTPGRIVTAGTTGYRGVTRGGEVDAVVSGRLRHAASRLEDLPAVGDWVALEDGPAANARRIVAVLPRRSAFLRHAPGRRVEAQVVGANVDTVLLVSALTHDLNPRRMERYLGAAWASGATPIVVLSKSDLSPDVEAALALIAEVASGVPIHVISALTGAGLDELAAHLLPGRTVAVLGSSGVGKSTLVNVLLGHARQEVRETREDDERGRHTTTSRELIMLPGGAIVLDTPGLRELALWDDEGIERAFADVHALAAECRFNDCAHESEPECAVRAAIEDGRLSPSRLASLRKIERELAALERRGRAGARAAARRLGRAARETADDALARKGGSSEG